MLLLLAVMGTAASPDDELDLFRRAAPLLCQKCKGGWNAEEKWAALWTMPACGKRNKRGGNGLCIAIEFYNKAPSHDPGHGTGAHWH